MPHASATYKAPPKDFYKPPAQKTAPTDLTARRPTRQKKAAPNVNADEVGTQEEFEAPPLDVEHNAPIAEVVVVATGLNDSGIAVTPCTPMGDNGNGEGMFVDGTAIPTFGSLTEENGIHSDDDGLFDPNINGDHVASSTPFKVKMEAAVPASDAFGMCSTTKPQGDRAATQHDDQEAIEILSSDDDSAAPSTTASTAKAIVKTDAELCDTSSNVDIAGAAAEVDLADDFLCDDAAMSDAASCKDGSSAAVAGEVDEDSEDMEVWGADDDDEEVDDEEAKEETLWHRGRKFIESSEDDDDSDDEFGSDEEDEGEEAASAAPSGIASDHPANDPSIKISCDTIEEAVDGDVHDVHSVVEIVKTRKRKGRDREYQCKRSGQGEFSWAKEQDLQVHQLTFPPCNLL